MASLGRMLGGFLLVLVGLSLTPTVSTAATQAAGNVSGAAEIAILGIVGLFWVVGILVGAAKIAGISVGK